MEVSYTPKFLRVLRSLPSSLQGEAIEAIDLLKDPTKHKQLKVHKLHGNFRGCFALSVNYKIRIIFQYLAKPKRASLLTIDSHDVYNS